ncbi:MAG TPA: von Willebrand factor type A domain-containing protein [Luteolibacter sp.]|nr:von Willebrand factor type A domain-containing protein [Luteolibacter sp.]
MDGFADANGTLAGRVGGTAFPVTPATPTEIAANTRAEEQTAQPRPAGRVITEEVRYKIDESDKQPAHDASDADYWDTSKLAAANTGKDKELEIHAGYKNEYLFRGVALDVDASLLPDDPEALAKAIREQEDKVEERRKVLATIVRTKGINYKGQDSFYSQEGVDEHLGARSALQAYHELERDKIQLETQINSLLKYDSEQLMVYAAGLDLPDNNVRQLYPKYLEAKRQLEGETLKGLGDEHPSVKAKVEQMEALKRQLDESDINLRQTRRAQLELATNRLKEAEAMKDQPRELAIKRAADAHDYVDAKREFEQDQELLQQMKLKLMRAKAEAPKPDLTKLMEEISAAEEPYSTFSLNISDASFRIAQAALAKGEQPDPAGIKVEQFYNAVDYGDPAPASNEPVACAIEQAAHPVIPGRNLVRIALKTSAVGRSAAQPLRLTLLVDQSGSMTRADRRAAMDKALAGLAGLLTKDDVVNVIGFSRTPRLLADGMTGDQAGKLADLVNQSASEGGTNLEEAMKLSEQLALRHQQPGAQNRIVLFTDGAANLGDADPERLAEKVKDLRQKGIAFDIAGIAADDLNDALLGELARNGNGRYYVVGKDADDNFAKQLAGAFRPAAENVKVQVRFNPERVARYKLIGFEKDRLRTEDFRNDKVDAAELAAEEAGVAIYQVEPLPEGRGEIGEVSVRFRDTAAGEMVERAWTIPHDAAAPALDRATPSMQLATLAMLAAEKLKGGPLGEAVDFRQFAAAQAEVKAYYSGNPRVAELLRMVEMLK